MFRKLSFVMIPLLIVAVLLLALPGTALADEGGPPDVVVVQVTDGEDGDEPPIDLSEPTTLAETLEYLLTVILGGGSMAFLFEGAKWFHKLDSGNRRWIIIGTNAILAAVSAAILEFVPPEKLIALEPYWRIVSVIIGVYFVSQVTHRMNKGKPVTADGTS